MNYASHPPKNDIIRYQNSTIQQPSGFFPKLPRKTVGFHPLKTMMIDNPIPLVVLNHTSTMVSGGVS
jgi:hypothetical protein